MSFPGVSSTFFCSSTISFCLLTDIPTIVFRTHNHTLISFSFLPLQPTYLGRFDCKILEIIIQLLALHNVSQFRKHRQQHLQERTVTAQTDIGVNGG
jgi:hypothetical protein